MTYLSIYLSVYLSRFLSVCPSVNRPIGGRVPASRPVRCRLDGGAVAQNAGTPPTRRRSLTISDWLDILSITAHLLL